MSILRDRSCRNLMNQSDGGDGISRTSGIMSVVKPMSTLFIVSRGRVYSLNRSEVPSLMLHYYTSSVFLTIIFVCIYMYMYVCSTVLFVISPDDGD